MHFAGFSDRDIEKELSLSHQQIGRIIKKYFDFNTMDRKVGSGRKRITSDRVDRYIVREVQNNRKISVNQIKLNLRIEAVSNNTIVRRIKEGGEYNSYW
jgi:DNA-binding Lrp family transcriptional regulator